MSKTLKNRYVLIFATGNSHKVKEVKIILKDYPIEIRCANVKGMEIQSEVVEDIAKASALQAFKKIGAPVFVEDSALSVETLNGFPGPFSSYVYNTLGIAGVLKLLKDVTNRRAEFKSAIAFCASDINPIHFLGSTIGRISKRERGIHGFGFDPIFEPDGENDKTFAEMTIKEKNTYSHRGRAVRKFIEWYLRTYKKGCS